MNKGKYTLRGVCRLCKSKRLVRIFNFNDVPLAGNYLKEVEIGKESLYPVSLYACQDCSFVQVGQIIDPKILFADYRYISSIPLAEHFYDFAQTMKEKILKKGSFIVEIGSNDGVLLKPLKDLGMEVLGVDPAANIAQIANDQGLETIVDFFTKKTAMEIVKNKKKQTDAVFANNVLAHIDDMDEVFEGINILLKFDGVLVFEVYYLVDLIDKLQYDIIYHEHHSYYSLTSQIPFLKKYGLEIFDVERVPTHSGSIRVYAQKIEYQPFRKTRRFQELSKMEESMNLSSAKTYLKFGRKVIKHSDDLWLLLSQLKAKGKKIVGYGASGRGNMLLTYCQIDKSILDYIVDESPERYGRYTPKTHIPIVSPSKFRNDYPDYALLLAWGYGDMIMKKEREFTKQGGKWIMPLPEIKIV